MVDEIITYRVWDDVSKITNSEKAMLELADIPKYQWCESALYPEDCDIEAFNRLTHIRNNLDTFLHTFRHNLVICGKNLGCGKTEWALKLMLTYFENSNHKFRFIDVNEGYKMNIGVFCQTVPFLVDIKQCGNNQKVMEKYERMKTAELVVFDDIAAVPMSKYDYNVIYALVERRLFSGLPCIYTTNATSEAELTKELGPRLAERIWKTSKVIELRGEGHRGV
jgi:DNA replication protein DnaC